MSSLFIFILQIATLRIGKQTTTSPFATFGTNVLSTTAFQTIFWYMVSGWWFSEAYIWSSPDLGWITRGGHNTPDVLNERPIFFRLYALVLALIYAAVHLYLGNSTLIIPVSRLSVTPTTAAKTPSIHPLEPVLTQIQRKLIPALLRSAIIAVILVCVTPFLYTFCLRQVFWKVHLTLAKPFFNLSRSNTRPVGYPILGFTFLARSLLAGFLLVLTWDMVSVLFLTYLNQEPTKNGLPLSTASKDPNGTLLNGLKAKTDVVKTFAFWELAIIAHKHKDRRKAIFEDIERPTGPIWGAMLEAGLKILRDIDARILGPQQKAAEPATNGTIKTLPQIVPELRTQSIFQAGPKPTMGEMLVSSPLRQIGSSKNPWHPPLEQTTRAVETKLLEYTKGPGARQTESPNALGQWTASLQRSPIGWFFSSPKAAKMNAAVLGSPNSNLAAVVDVVDSITTMLVASLSEDTYGKATPTVPETVRTFTKTLTTVEDFVAKIGPSVNAGSEDVEIVIERLRSGLKELLSAFQAYLLDVGLGIADLNQAKKAIESREPQVADPSEQPVRRQLFSGSSQKEKSSNRQRPPMAQADHRDRIDSSHASSDSRRRKPANGSGGRQHQRREMEQVR